MLQTVDEQRHALDGNPGDREALRTVRRQFHTLKGSGRMVGLVELGELAFAVEKILNRLLEDDHTVTPEALAMIATAHREFTAWVEAISANGRVAVDPAVLHAAIDAVEAELPQGRESALKPTPAAPEPAADVPAAAGPVESPDPSDEVELFALPELGSSQEASSPQVISLFDAVAERSARSAVRRRSGRGNRDRAGGIAGARVRLDTATRAQRRCRRRRRNPTRSPSATSCSPRRSSRS